jgi:glycosyltransferase involved in cell wall biosynthesis
MLAVTYPGDANSSKTYGGSPLSIATALRRYAPSTIGLDLALPKNHQIRRYAWNLKEAALLRGSGGYQYSDEFLNRIWRNDSRISTADAVINMFQNYSDEFFFSTKARRLFYIDQTLDQLFNFYVDNARISERHRRTAIEREKRQYRACEKIICKSNWAAASVIDNYGVAPEKVAILKPGGNIDPAAYAAFEQQRAKLPLQEVTAFSADRPLRVVFVGKEPRRKGLFRFIDALPFVEQAHRRVHLTVIGPELSTVPPDYRDVPGVEWVGPIDKGRDTQRFIDLVSKNDLGILLSTIDAGGLSLREFQMLGLAVLAPKVGGSWEMAVEGAGLFVNPTDGPEVIAGFINRLLDEPGLVSTMKQMAWAARHELTLDYAAQELLRLAYED